MSDIDTIRERHWQNPDGKCASGDHAYPSAWPCDTRVVLDALDSSRKAHRDAHEMASWYEDRERAARADADRLAEALRQVQQCLVTLDSESLSMLGRDALEAAKTWPDEALRLHDKAAKVVA